jgi:hypothetical protein
MLTYNLESIMPTIHLFKDENFQGEEIVLNRGDENLINSNFNDTISSIFVETGTWTGYEHVNFQGISVTFAPNGGPQDDGRYPNASYFGGLNDQFSSIRMNDKKS